MDKSPFLAIIPARGSSKGLPRKNVRPLNGKPLIAHTIEAALKTSRLGKVLVSSEDKEILETAARWGAGTVKRPDVLAMDNANGEDVIAHALEEEKKLGQTYEHIIFLQPTSPLRTPSHIDKALDIYLEANAGSLISVVMHNYIPFKCFVIEQDNTLKGLYDNSSPFKNRQELPPCYLSNGAIYIIRVELFKNNPSFYQDKCVPMVMNFEESIDIDSLEDLQAAERFLKGGAYA